MSDASVADQVRQLYPPNSVMRLAIENDRRSFFTRWCSDPRRMVLGDDKNVYVGDRVGLRVGPEALHVPRHHLELIPVHRTKMRSTGGRFPPRRGWAVRASPRLREQRRRRPRARRGEWVGPPPSAAAGNVASRGANAGRSASSGEQLTTIDERAECCGCAAQAAGSARPPPPRSEAAARRIPAQCKGFEVLGSTQPGRFDAPEHVRAFDGAHHPLRDPLRGCRPELLTKYHDEFCVLLPARSGSDPRRT